MEAKSTINSVIIMEVILAPESTRNVQRERKFAHPVILIRSRFTFHNLKRPHRGLQKFIWLCVMCLSLHNKLMDRILGRKHSSDPRLHTVAITPIACNYPGGDVDLNSIQM